MTMKAFLSSNFDPIDKNLVDKFKEIILSLNIEIYQANYIPKIREGITQRIAELDMVVTILTEKMPNAPSDYVKFELATALALNKPVIIFREDNIEIQDIYKEFNQIEFSRKDLLQSDELAIERIENAILEHLEYYKLKVNVVDPEIEKRYDFAKAQAQLLGSKILGYFNNTLYKNKVRNANVKNFPTDADIEANEIIRRAIKDDFTTKKDGIISEETKDDIVKILNENEFVWIIDPLDGTLNFAYNFPFFCISIGLLRKGKPILGVLYNPTTQELYCGLEHTKSYCLDLKLGIKRMLKIENSITDLKDCILMTHLSSDRNYRKITIDILDTLAENCRSIRMLGSGQMALASLSLGQFDVFYNYCTNIWDIVPGFVILKGAGGYVSTSMEKDNYWDLYSRGIIAAANSEIGEKFRRLIRKELNTDFIRYDT
jgi:Archaeal fructose-1,6-bisphosphatase and related enzymes of inositol monophosphatase family